MCLVLEFNFINLNGYELQYNKIEPFQFLLALGRSILVTDISVFPSPSLGIDYRSGKKSKTFLQEMFSFDLASRIY